MLLLNLKITVSKNTQHAASAKKGNRIDLLGWWKSVKAKLNWLEVLLGGLLEWDAGIHDKPQA